MYDLIRNTVNALGNMPAPQPGAVGAIGSLPIPNSKQYITQLLSYAAWGSYETPMGRLVISAAAPTPRPGQIPRMLISGELNGDPLTYAPKIPADLVDLAAGRPAQFGQIELTGLLALPKMLYDAKRRTVELQFIEPFAVNLHVDKNSSFFRRKFGRMVDAELYGIVIDQDKGVLKLNRAANWIAPTLLWK